MRVCLNCFGAHNFSKLLKTIHLILGKLGEKGILDLMDQPMRLGFRGMVNLISKLVRVSLSVVTMVVKQ